MGQPKSQPESRKSPSLEEVIIGDQVEPKGQA